MPNIENLTPFQSVDEARDKGKLGGIASGKKRREQKRLSDALIFAFQRNASDSSGNPILDKATGEPLTILEAIVQKIVSTMGELSVPTNNLTLKELKTLLECMVIIRDTMGEKPTNTVALSTVSQEALDAFDAVVGLEYLDANEIEVLRG